MANIQIPNLPAVASLSGAELFEGVQAGTSVKISLDQVIAASRGGTPTTLPLTVSVGGTGVSTISGYIKGSGTSPFTGSATIPNTDITGLGTMSTQNAGAVAITGGSITGITNFASNNVTITGGSITGITDLAVADGGTGVSTLTGYVKGNGTSPFTASATVPSTDITGLGTMSVQNANNVTITGGSITGITDLAVADGGTGLSTYTVGDILYASAISTLAKLPDVATGNALISGGVGVAPLYGKIGLTTHVSDVLPVANGGTGVVTAPAEAARIFGFTSTATAAGTTILTADSTQYQLFTGTLAQTITLPVTSTIATGWSFHIVNNSTGNLTVNSSGGNLVCTIIPQLSAMVTCIGTTLTTAADWEFGFTDFGSVTGTGSVVLGTGPTITNGALNGTVGATTPSTGAFTTVAASTSILSSGGGVGYATGAGVAVTQATSRTTTTPTTGANPCGSITVFTAAPVVGTYFSFTVPNTSIAVTDTVILSVRGGSNTYVANCSQITAATSFRVTMVSVAGTASDSPIVNFAIIKGVSA